MSARGTLWKWLRTGDETFAAMLSALDAAQHSICLETYIFSSEGIGARVRDALIRARERSVTVRVLVDALGSSSLSSEFWQPLRAVGGQIRLFNPLTLNRLGIRNHRKLLVCDDELAFLGGFNIAPEYEGNGLTKGWRDVAVCVGDGLARQLALSFDEMFALADFRHKRPARLARARHKKTVLGFEEQLLLGGPGRGRNPFRHALLADLRGARNVQIMVAYFLPTWSIRTALTRAARRGGRVQLILSGKSDVAVAQLAGRNVYPRLLRAGVEVYEYQPQILHAKLLVVDDAVYVGSANLDPRSLTINYEVMVRNQSPPATAEARTIFSDALQHSQRVTLAGFRSTENLWARLKRRWAYFLLARIDPYIARRQWSSLPD